jgi:hypothetical protein
VQFNALSASPTLTPNTWTHLMVTRDTSTWTLYVNGVASTTGTASPNTPATSSSIGNNFPGSIDDVAFWNTTLSPAEVMTLYQSQAGGYSGVYHSRIMNSGANSSAWTSLKWAANLPLQKALPDAVGTLAQNEALSQYPALANASLMNGIVALWHLDEASGTTGAGSIKDTSGLSHHGAPTNNPVMGQNGQIAKSAQFNGSSSYIEVVDSDSLTLGTSFTLSAWVKPNSFTGLSSLLSKWAQGIDDEFTFMLTASGNLSLGWHSQGGDTYATAAYNSANSSGTVPPGRWSHILVVRQGPTITFYINGVAAGTSAAADNFPLRNGSHVLRIGAEGDAAGRYLNGAMDEVAIWNRALSLSEVEQLYARGSSRILFQVRSCMTFNCSDGTWKGPDGSSGTYFSEEFNRATQAASPSGAVLATGPQLSLGSYTSAPANNRYFQYRVILGSQSALASIQPELRSVEIGPARYSSSQPTIQYKTAIQYNKLMDLTESLGAAGCPGGIHYSVSADGIFWFYYNGSTWDVADGSFSRANTASELKESFSSLTTLSKAVTYVRAHLNSSGSQPCELDQILVSGER